MFTLIFLILIIYKFSSFQNARRPRPLPSMKNRWDQIISRNVMGIPERLQVRWRNVRNRNGNLLFLVVCINFVGFRICFCFMLLIFLVPGQPPLLQNLQRHIPAVAGFEEPKGSTNKSENINTIALPVEKRKKTT